MNFISVFVLVMAVLVWGFLHSLTASLQFKSTMRRLFGQGVDRYFRLFYNLFSMVSFLPVLLVAIMIPDRFIYLVPFPWVVLMVVGEVLAIAALIIAFRQTDMLEFFGLQQIRGRRVEKPRKLVTGGLYTYVRHPQYTAGLAVIWLLPFMTARILVINLALTVYVVAGAYMEERKLRHKFGQEYVAYAAETPMFIPYLKKFRRRLGV